MATRTRALPSYLPPLQNARGCLAGALSLATMPALRIWRRGRFCERATRVVAADDCLFSPALIGVAVTKHRRQRVTYRVSVRRDAGAAVVARQFRAGRPFISTGPGDELVDGP